MTVYARSDVMLVSLSKNFGGCGATHTRPVTQGSPDKVWALNCFPCEDHLRSDPHWATNTMEIPETPDEERLREDDEKKGASRRLATQEELIHNLAQSQEGMQRLLTILTAAMTSSNPELAKAFAALSATAAVSAETVAQAADVMTMTSINDQRAELGLAPWGDDVITATDDKPLVFDGLTTATLAGLPVRELRVLAQQRGLDSTGTRDQLIKRLKDLN